MTIKEKNQGYQIRELSYRKEAGSIRLHWKYKEAAQFLIFVFDSRQGFDLQTVCEETALADVSDGEILDTAKKQFTVGKDCSWKMIYRTKAEFVRDGRCVRLPANEWKKEVPYGICVFACMYDEKQDELYVYETGRQENTCFVPVKIEVEKRYKKRLFSKEKYCILRLPKLEDYTDGAVLYHVDGVDSDFPLPYSCMGRELTIVVPKQAQVNIRIREEDKKYFYMPYGE